MLIENNTNTQQTFFYQRCLGWLQQCITLLLLASTAQAQFSEEPELLPAVQAFQVSATAKDSVLTIQYLIAEGYYLYKHAFKFNSDQAQLGTPNIPKGKVEHDEFFGEVETYRNFIEITIPIQRMPDNVTELAFTASSQGCADIGVCYPPLKQQISSAYSGQTVSAGTSTDVYTSEQDKIATTLASGHTLLTLLTFFGFGLLLTFTPCVFPMIPILAGIIVGQKEQLNTTKALSLSVIYVLAMAVTYTIAGVMVGMTGDNVQALFQTPWVLYSFAVVFVLLSLSMFGLYELQMPQAIQSRLASISHNQQGGTYIGAGIMGFLSALIVGPCVTAPLIGALLYIAQTGDAILGGAALFALSLGMGTPLIIIGTTAGKWLPKAGRWMDSVKNFFGVMLLAIAIWLLDRIVPSQVTLLLTAVLLIATGVYMGALQFSDTLVSGKYKLQKMIGVLVFIYGLLILIGAASGGSSLLEPLKHLAQGKHNATHTQHLLFKPIKGLADLQQALAKAKASNQPVMLDFYADWCVSCKEMEAFTFSKASVQTALSDYILLQSDVTANDDADKALLKALGLVGPPAILFYNPQGDELRNYRVVGFVPEDKFVNHIKRLRQFL